MKIVNNNTQIRSVIGWLVLGLVVAMASCANEPQRKKTANGFEYELTKDEPGDVPVMGDYVLFRIEVFADDSLISSMKDVEYPQEFQWVPDEERLKMKNPVVDLFGQMSKGDIGSVYFPTDSMPGQRPPGFEGVDMLRYEVAIEDVLNTEGYSTYTNRRQAKLRAEKELVMAREEGVKNKLNEVMAKYKAGTLEDLRKDIPGMDYVILEAGSGAQPEVGEKVKVHYYGVLKSDGSMFDNSFSRGTPIEFPLGQGRVIQGWDEGIGKLKGGDKAVLFIPYDKAYGAAGRPPSIPEKADLVFYVELM